MQIFEKSLKEKHDYFGKLNIQKKGELQKYLHKKNGHFAEILGKFGIKKHFTKVTFLGKGLFVPFKMTQQRIRSWYHIESAKI